jgi:phytoene synthase
MNASKPIPYTGSSFYWALKVLPPDKRDAMFRIYGFCREVDDIADGSAPLDVKRAHLASYRAAVEALFQDRPTNIASVQNLKPVIADFHIRKADLLAVIDGMEADAVEAVRIADEAAFDRYLDQVACAVGRLSDKVFGLEGPAADKLAYHLGRALQITNILRDLGEDAERDRLYLPADLLARHGMPNATPADVLAHPNLDAALDELATRAEGCFRRADEALAHLDRSRTRSARMMKAVYRETLRRLRRRGLARIHQPVRLSKPLKLWYALRGMLG